MSKAIPTPVKGRSTETLHRAVNSSNSPEALHTDPECPRLAGADRTREVERAQYPHTPICKVCQGEGERGEAQSGLAAKLRAADSAEEALNAESLAELKGGESA